MKREKEIIELILSIPIQTWIKGAVTIDNIMKSGRAVVGFELNIEGVKAFISNGMGRNINSVLRIGSFEIVSEQIAELSLKLALIIQEQDRIEKSDREDEIYDKLNKYLSSIK